MSGRCYIGTSGWVYPHWRGIFYPEGLPQRRWFAHYARRFDTVEVNYSFYRLPSEATVDRWREEAPDGFVYAAKASRYLTHVRRLQDAAEPLDRFLSRVGRLEGRLGPVLYQLPPRWHVDLERLDAFLALLPPDLIHVFEFRDASWFVEPVFELLSRYGHSFCIMSMPGMECPVRATSSVVYIRMHGSGTVYGGRYSEAELEGWAEQVRRFSTQGRDVYVYFNNDVEGFAVENALELRALLGACAA